MSLNNLGTINAKCVLDIQFHGAFNNGPKYSETTQTNILKNIIIPVKGSILM